MFVRGENGFFYLHDAQGRILQVVGDGMTWVYQYEGADKARVVLHGQIREPSRPGKPTETGDAPLVGRRVTLVYEPDGSVRWR